MIHLILLIIGAIVVLIYSSKTMGGLIMNRLKTVNPKYLFVKFIHIQKLDDTIELKKIQIANWDKKQIKKNRFKYAFSVETAMFVLLHLIVCLGVFAVYYAIIISIPMGDEIPFYLNNFKIDFFSLSAFFVTGLYLVVFNSIDLYYTEMFEEIEKAKYNPTYENIIEKIELKLYR